MPTKSNTDVYVTIIGKVEEHLVLGKKEWLTIRLENNQIITINKNLCKEFTNDK